MKLIKPVKPGLKRGLWKSEEDLFRPLMLRYGENSVSFHTGMKEVIEVSDSRLTQEERDYMFRGAHFDFVAYDSEYNPIFAFELDGWPHLFDKKQIKRDERKDSICKKMGLPLIRISRSTLETLNEDSELATWANTAGMTPDEIIADIVGMHEEMATNPEFAEFVSFLENLDTPVRFARVGYGYSHLIEMVEDYGLTGAKQFIMNIVDHANYVQERVDASGFTDEMEQHLVRYAVLCFRAYLRERVKELEISRDEFGETKELEHVRYAYKALTKKLSTFESATAWDNLAAIEEWAKAGLLFYASTLKIMRGHQPVLGYYRELVKCDLRLSDEPVSSEEEIAEMLECFTSVMDYLEDVKSNFVWE
jgi:hypothetical protein